MRRTLQVLLVVVVAVAAFSIFLKFRYAGKAPLRLLAENCNSDLWRHVYEPDRLRVIEACTAVEGRVVGVRQAQDGDLHIALDPDHKSVLNLVNVMHGESHLVVEIVCHHQPSEHDDKIPCAGFTSQVLVPAAGDRIRVTGAYVTDTDNGWNEIHPVTRIDVLR